ncbi:MAG: redoxin domain-containing protein [Phycisphaerae bacterium]|nr:redoxin domain-containing protein [Phycisphaerae bacterium]
MNTLLARILTLLGTIVATASGASTQASERLPTAVHSGNEASEGPDYAEKPKFAVRESQPARTLRIGDPAPALSVEEWTLGGPVGTFQAGTAYVVVFVPSSHSKLDPLLESISKLSERFADQPVQVLAIGGSEEKTTRQTWRSKIDSMKAHVRFPLGWDKGVESRSAYLTATGEQQPTIVFVIDTKGRLAWYGPPGATTEILRPVLADEWPLEQVRNEIEAAEDLSWIRIDVIRSQRTRDLERFVRSGERMTTGFADPPSFEFAEALRDDLMDMASEMLQSDSVFDARKDPRLAGLLLKVTERAARIDRNNKPRTLTLLARAQAINNDKASALKSARKALELAADMVPPDRDLIDQLTRDVAEYGTR